MLIYQVGPFGINCNLTPGRCWRCAVCFGFPPFRMLVLLNLTKHISPLLHAASVGFPVSSSDRINTEFIGLVTHAYLMLFVQYMLGKCPTPLWPNEYFSNAYCLHLK